MSKDQEIMDEVYTRLQNISMDNGYHTDAGLNVRLDAYEPEDQIDDFPVLTLEDAVDDLDDLGDYSDDMDGFVLSVAVYGYDIVPDGVSAGAHGRKLISDIKNAVCDPTRDRRLPDADGEHILLDNIAPAERAIELPPTGHRKVGVRVTFASPYLELYGQTK